MKRKATKVMAYVVAAVMAVTGLGITSEASGVIYQEEEISITAQLDAYIESQPSLLAEFMEEEEEQMSASSAKYPEFEGKAIPKVSGNVNIRAEADEYSEKKGQLTEGALVTVEGQTGDWTQITSGGISGYVKTEFLAFGDEAGAYAEEHLSKQALITTETLMVRAEQSTESSIVSMVAGGLKYDIINRYDDWTEIELDDSHTGYVSNDYVDVVFKLTTASPVDQPTTEEQDDDDSTPADDDDDAPADDDDDDAPAPEDDDHDDGVVTPTRQAVCDYAVQFVGNPYVWGGESLTNGADCSGFTLAVYKHFGISLPHSSRMQAQCGKAISVSDRRPGDLLFYEKNGTINHVALYIGNNKVVHASSPSSGIKISTYNYRTPCAAVSLLD